MITRRVVFALGVLLLVGGCGQSEAEKNKQAILAVVTGDQRLAAEREKVVADATPAQIARQIGDYCAQIERLDLSGCPADFRTAYQQNIQAWRELQSAVAKLPDTLRGGLWMGGVNGIVRNTADGSKTRLEGPVEQGCEHVGATWLEVKKIGAKYGCDF